MCLYLVSACMDLYVISKFHGVLYRINCKIENSSLLLKSTFIYLIYIYIHMYVHVLLGVCDCQISKSVRVIDFAPCGSWGLDLDLSGLVTVTFTH